MNSLFDSDRGILQPDSLALPTLLDLIVHAAPDTVLGDGGSLYLRRAPGVREEPRSCPGCPAAGRCRRAYLAATTRDHRDATLAEHYYCANPERYVEAGKAVADLLAEGIAVVEERLKADVTTAIGRMTVHGRPADRALAVFSALFCPVNMEAMSVTSNAILESLRDGGLSSSVARDLTTRHDMAAAGFAATRPLACDLGGLHDEPRESLLRYCAALVPFCGTASATTVPAAAERDAALNGIVWELLRTHPLLAELYDGYTKGLEAVRTRFRSLGLSGWCCAFGTPIRLRNIENPFEIKAFAKAAGGQHDDLPMPLWGDRTRGHRDRLEREGRPFLVVPLLAPGTRNTVGFVRVATKREGERQFTEYDERRLSDYAAMVAEFVLPQMPVDAPDEPYIRSRLAANWQALRLYGAVKGQAVKDLGASAAQVFLDAFGASAASLFLREDLWPADRPSPEDTAGGRRPSAEGGDRRYVLWGTKSADGHSLFEAGVGREYYTETQGKTGWVLKHKAAVQAEYPENGRLLVRLPGNQQLTATMTDDGHWEYELPRATPAADPYDLQSLVQKLGTKQQTEEHHCELPPEQHRGFLAAPLIDPDESPEPLGVVRLVFADHQPLTTSSEALLERVARLARALSRLLFENLQPLRLLGTFPRLVEHATRTYENRANRIVEQSIVSYGPYGQVAGSLLGLGEASAVSVFVHNRFAPSAYRARSLAEDSWVLAGAAASRDSLASTDLSHFEHDYCRQYFQDQRGVARYRAGQGRTGGAIETGRTTEFADPDDENEKSGLHCEVLSRAAVVVVPVLGRPADGHRPGDTVAVVRLVRTPERRRARFLPDEIHRVETVAGALRWLVPAWSGNNEFQELARQRTEEGERVFPSALRGLLAAAIVEDARALGLDNGDPERVVARRAAQCPDWTIEAPSASGSVPPHCHPDRRSASDVRRDENALLAWFLRSLETPTPDRTLADLVDVVLAALVRVHWGPTQAEKWVAKLRDLERFEPVLAQLPRYRDHSIHQLQVFLIGWLLMRWLDAAGILSFHYQGWTESLEAADCSTDSPSDRCGANAWVLACLLHDVAYPLQHVHDWANLFGRTLTGGVHASYVSQGEPRALLQRGAAFNRAATLLAERLAEVVQRPEGFAEDWARAIQGAVERRAALWDHGVWAALVLLRDGDPTEAILSAAGAIALHAGMISEVVNLEGHLVVPLERGESGTTGRSVGPAVLPFMLALSDGLHEWGRELGTDQSTRLPEQDLPAFAGLWSRPRLVRMEATVSDGAPMMTVDIALGHGGGDTVDAKIRELDRLRAVLRPSGFSVRVRVGQGDPRFMELLDCNTVGFPARNRR